MVSLPEMNREESDETLLGPAGQEGRPVSGSFGIGFLAGILAALSCVFIFLLGWIAGQRISQKQQAADEVNLGAQVLTDEYTLYKLDEIQNLIEGKYLREVDSDTLSAYLFKGIATGLEDDYANYYSAEELQTVLDSVRGEYYGIGVTLSEDIDTNEISVLEVYDDSPASRSGLEIGDIIVSVDGVSVVGQGLTEAVTLIKSKEDSFTLGLIRPSTQEELEIELECDDVERSYVEYEMKENNIGYLKLAEFTQSAVKQFDSAVLELKNQGMEKLIIDLRNNPGGLLDSVCDILDEILPEGLIVYTEDRAGEREEHSADGKRSVTCEVAVLVNGNSASASEIFAGAIQDYEIGPVIGTQTYGKGVVQDTYTLSDGSAFKMTTQKYYTPKGQDIDGNGGITPDIEVGEDPSGEETDEVLAKAMEVLGE